MSADATANREKEWIEHTKKHDQWLDARGEADQKCEESNGVPVFTYGMKIFCVRKEAIVGGLWPEQDAPSMRLSGVE